VHSNLYPEFYEKYYRHPWIIKMIFLILSFFLTSQLVLIFSGVYILTRRIKLAQSVTWLGISWMLEFNFRETSVFPTKFKQVLIYNMSWEVPSLEIKWLECKTSHSPPYGTKVKRVWCMCYQHEINNIVKVMPCTSSSTK
jgi:hypothetical protein